MQDLTTRPQKPEPPRPREVREDRPPKREPELINVRSYYCTLHDTWADTPCSCSTIHPLNERITRLECELAEVKALIESRG